MTSGESMPSGEGISQGDKKVKSVKYLELIKAKHGFNSDRQLAIYLDKTTGTVSQYMTGARVMDDEMCLKIAMELGINPIEIVGAACIDRAEKTGQKSLWEVFMMRMATTASALLLAICVNLFLTPEAANAATAGLSKEPIYNTINYA